MKVIVTLAIDVDPEAWSDTYGTGTKAADVRDDVRRHVEATVQGSAPTQEGGFISVTLR